MADRAFGKLAGLLVAGGTTAAKAAPRPVAQASIDQASQLQFWRTKNQLPAQSNPPIAKRGNSLGRSPMSKFYKKIAE